MLPEEVVVEQFDHPWQVAAEVATGVAWVAAVA